MTQPRVQELRAIRATDQAAFGISQPTMAEEVIMQETDAQFTDEGVRERLDELEPELREEIETVTGRLGDLESFTEFLVRSAVGDPKRTERIHKARRAAEKARNFLPTARGGISAYDAERATAYATVSIAECLILLLESAAKAKR